VWAIDITFPMARGFVYLAVAIDWVAVKTAHNRRENQAALVAHPLKIVIVLSDPAPRSQSVGLKSQPIALFRYYSAACSVDSLLAVSRSRWDSTSLRCITSTYL
jgi:hypothetical protein